MHKLLSLHPMMILERGTGKASDGHIGSALVSCTPFRLYVVILSARPCRSCSARITAPLFVFQVLSYLRTFLRRCFGCLLAASASPVWKTLTVMPLVPNSRKRVIFPCGRVRPNIVERWIVAITRTVPPPVVSGTVPSTRLGGPKNEVVIAPPLVTANLTKCQPFPSRKRWI